MKKRDTSTEFFTDIFKPVTKDQAFCFFHCRYIERQNRTFPLDTGK